MERERLKQGTREAADRLSQLAVASGSNWARGAAARSRALVSGGLAADDLYREAIELLARTRMATHLARARLAHGGRTNRRSARSCSSAAAPWSGT